MDSCSYAVCRLLESGVKPFRTGKSAEHLRWISFVIFYTVLANIPFWAASRWLGLLPLGWFCLEYAAVGFIALFVPRIFAAALLLLVIFADLVSAVSKTYYLSPTECLANVTSLHEFSARRLLVIAAVAFLTLLVALTAALFPVAALQGSYRRSAVGCLIAFAALFMFADCLAVVRSIGHIPNPFRLEMLSDTKTISEFKRQWMARYPTIRLVRSQTFFSLIRNHETVSKADSFSVPNATVLAIRSAALGDHKSGHELPNLVLVLVESWGLDADSPLRDALTRPYFQSGLLARYQVFQGTVPFDGTTVNGEGRELCGSTIGFHLVNAPTPELRNCLPDRLAALGYHSLALHGMDGHMFDRSSWYRTIGFQEQWFRDRFRQQGLPDCVGTFTGTCDAAIADWIGHRLETNDTYPDFVYWVTLNSHLPVPVPSPLSDGASCSVTPSLAQEPALCSWYQLVFNVHDSVSRIAMSKLDRPTVFVVVGDHAPPFSNPALVSQFSSENVPYVLLVPRGGSRNATLMAGAINFGLRPGVVAGRGSSLANHACRIQYGDGVVHSTPTVCP